MNLTRFALTLTAAAVLAGCASNVKLDDPAPVKTAEAKPAVTAPAQPAQPAQTAVPTSGKHTDQLPCNN